MNSIEFRVQLSSQEPNDLRGGRSPIVAIFRRFAVAEDHPHLAGGYQGLPASAVLPPSRHFLGEPNEDWFKYAEKIALYECECGCPGCWPFLARITVNRDTVKWSEFEQPHRGPHSVAGWWRYDDLGPYIFDRAQYVATLASAADELRNLG